MWLDSVATYEGASEINLLTEAEFIQGLRTLGRLSQEDDRNYPTEIQALGTQMQHWQREQLGRFSTLPPEYLQYRDFRLTFQTLSPARRRCL